LSGQTPERRIRILLIEDHFLARLALRSILEAQSDMEVVAESGAGGDALALFRQHAPDVVIVDLRLPGISGFDVIEQLKTAAPRVRILVLTSYDGSEDVYRALHAGALAYLLKDTSGEDLVQAIHSVAKGLRYLPSAVSNRLAERLATSELTVREVEVLELIAQGLSNKEIADRLGIAEKTVRIHSSSILAKMGVADRTQAAIAAIQRGLVHLQK
jgi:DNA-binding NarL/FixJ family response regulator